MDDGTGNIKVVLFIPSDRPKDFGQFGDSILAEKLKKSFIACGSPQIGQTVDIKGTPQVRYGVTEIKCIYAPRLVLDPNDEVERMFIVDKLRHSNIYSKFQ